MLCPGILLICILIRVHNVAALLHKLLVHKSLCWPSLWLHLVETSACFAPGLPGATVLVQWSLSGVSMTRCECSVVLTATEWVQWLKRGNVHAAQIECYCVNANIAIAWTWLSDCWANHVVAKTFFTKVKSLGYDWISRLFALLLIC